MRISKLLFILAVIVFCAQNAQAQKKPQKKAPPTQKSAPAQSSQGPHNTREGSACKYAKNRCTVGEGCPICRACDVENEKERQAKIAEDRRRDAVIAAESKIKLEAEQKAAKEKLKKELEASNKVTEVRVTAPKTPPSTTTKADLENIGNYKIVNEFKAGYGMDSFTTYNSKILFKDKVVFESDEFLWLKAVWGKLLFIADYPRQDDSCKESEANNSILLDKNGKQVKLDGVDRFGYLSSNDDNDDYIDIHVYTGECTPVENDRYAKGDWHTTVYVFDYKTLKLIETKPSWQHANCECE